jgi:hypothetical protein
MQRLAVLRCRHITGATNHLKVAPSFMQSSRHRKQLRATLQATTSPRVLEKSPENHIAQCKQGLDHSYPDRHADWRTLPTLHG